MPSGPHAYCINTVWLSGTVIGTFTHFSASNPAQEAKHFNQTLKRVFHNGTLAAVYIDIFLVTEGSKRKKI